MFYLRTYLSLEDEDDDESELELLDLKYIVFKTFYGISS